MKRKKTHAPQANVQEIQAIFDGMERLLPPQHPFDFGEGGRTAEAAKRLYEAAERLHRSFP